MMIIGHAVVEREPHIVSLVVISSRDLKVGEPRFTRRSRVSVISFYHRISALEHMNMISMNVRTYLLAVHGFNVGFER
jgi:hypothetical protein